MAGERSVESSRMFRMCIRPVSAIAVSSASTSAPWVATLAPVPDPTLDHRARARAAESNLYQVTFERARSLRERLGGMAASVLDRSFPSPLSR